MKIKIFIKLIKRVRLDAKSFKRNRLKYIRLEKLIYFHYLKNIIVVITSVNIIIYNIGMKSKQFW